MARTLTCVAIILVMAACFDNSGDSPAGPSVSQPPTPGQQLSSDLSSAIAAQRRHTEKLLAIPGVVGTAVGLSHGHAGVLLLVERDGLSGLPQALDGVAVDIRVTGRIMVFSDPTQRQRPAPMGFSIGHPAITAGTIGARVRDAQGRVYILSNNHVLANSNGANIGDPEYQPGTFDGGTAADQIATLSDFQAINFSGVSNTMDAAIALSSTDVLDNAVPADDGYGMPNSTMYGDANGDGVFDDRDALLGLNVQKYGRTTRLTHGQITGVNATITVCYAVSGVTCTKTARFVDQLIISPGGFSGGGDSGSLIVTDDANLNPVGLLFAGSTSVTIANRIDLVLNRFGVVIDGFAPPPPGPLTDLAITGLAGPSLVVQNTTGNLAVTVKNFGNQDVSGVEVTLEDTTAHVVVGTQTLGGLVAGASATLNFAWTPASTGDHNLVASHSLSDDRPGNDRRSLTVAVAAPLTDIAVTAITAAATATQGHIVNVGVTVANVGNQSVAGSFDVALQDATDGTPVGTQTVTGLAVGANKFLTFSWDLSSASLGDHTLIATQTLADDNSGNNRRSATVTVNPKPTDIAVTAITAPARVPLGDTAHILVTVKNTGEVDVTTPFNVELTDGYAGPVVGTQTVAALAAGASATVDFPWSTAGAATNGHTLFATQKLPDAVWSNNSMAISVIVTPPADVAVTVNAPATVIQGSSVGIAVNVSNVGGQNATASFDITLRDATAGVTIGAATVVGGLQTGGGTSRTFTWNTTAAALGGHTLVATHTYPDGNAANNQSSVSVAVNAPANDVALTTFSAPAWIGKGSTANLSVTVHNVGGQNVPTSFNIVVIDQTAGGITLGTQTVAGLAPGASSTRSFSWNTGSAAVGSHTLIASHTLADDAAANNQRSATVNVLTVPADLSVVGISAPGTVTAGDTVPVTVMVQNVGGQDVTTSFDVVLTDGTAGNAVVGTQTIPGLAAGASATRIISWNTAGAAVTGHILTATQKLPDANSNNNARAIAITIATPRLHVGDLSGVGLSNGTTWSATARVTVHNSAHVVMSGVSVRGLWNGTGPEVQCVTDDTGTCTVVLASIPITTFWASFGVTGMILPGATYYPYANHDPDGSSNGYSQAVRRP